MIKRSDDGCIEVSVSERPDVSGKFAVSVLIPMKVDSDSDLIPVTRSDGMPVTFGA